MDVKLFQDSVVFVSALTVEDYETAAKFVPAALTLVEKDEDTGVKNEIFKILFNSIIENSVEDAGIVFNSITEDKHLCVTLNIHDYSLRSKSMDAKLAQVTEDFANIIMNANKLEKQILKAVKDNAKLIEAAKKSITVVEA